MFRNSDEHLIKQVGEGDLAAFSALYDRYAPDVLIVCLKLNLDTAVAEQIVLETFWLVWQQADTFGSELSPFPAWLRRLARRVCLDSFRHHLIKSTQFMMEECNESAG